MDNPNEYSDDDYAHYSVELNSAVVSLWEAGASLGDIEAELESALENATGARVQVGLIV